MSKIPSTWYTKGDGADFHDKDKQILIQMLRNKGNLNLLKNLIMPRRWVDTKGEVLTKSMVLIGDVRAEFTREMPKLLKGAGWINRLAIQRLVDFLYVLHKTDDMYYERFGYLIGRIIEIYPEWEKADKVGRQALLQAEDDLYFTHEKREDRIPHIHAAWDYLKSKYESDEAIERCVNFAFKTFYDKREQYDPDELSRIGLTAFHPECWYPVGRGQMWCMIHGGQG